MIGTRLTVADVFYNEDMHIYVGKLLLARDYHAPEDDDAIDCMSVRQILKSCFGKAAVNRLETATTEEINIIFNQLYDLFPEERGWLEAVKYYYLAMHYQSHTVADYNEALLQYELCLEIYEKYTNDKELNIDFDIGQVHFEMGFIYEDDLDDCPLANKHWDLAIAYCVSSLNHAMSSKQKLDIYCILASSYRNKSDISNNAEEQESNIRNAIKYKEMELEETVKHYSPEHKNVADHLKSLADMEKSIFLWKEASLNYEKAVKIYLLQDKPEFSSVVFIYMEMHRWCTEQKHDYNLALHYKLKELEYRTKHAEARQNVSEITKNFMLHGIAICHREAAKIYIKLCQLESAREHLVKAKQIYENSTYFKKQKNILNL